MLHDVLQVLPGFGVAGPHARSAQRPAPGVPGRAVGLEDRRHLPDLLRRLRQRQPAHDHRSARPGHQDRLQRQAPCPGRSHRVVRHGRYVRINATALSAGSTNYSLWDVEVFGPTGVNLKPSPGARPVECGELEHRGEQGVRRRSDDSMVKREPHGIHAVGAGGSGYGAVDFPRPAHLGQRLRRQL